jgi:predicted transcriptional regulator
MNGCCFGDIMTCDEVVRIYLPQIRAELVTRLVQEKKLPQNRVAHCMGLSRAAVSQYVSKKRGCGNILISWELDEIINTWADGVISGDCTITICDICKCIDHQEKLRDMAHDEGEFLPDIR